MNIQTLYSYSYSYSDSIPSRELMDPEHSDTYLDEVAHATEPNFEHFTEHLCLSPAEV